MNMQNKILHIIILDKFIPSFIDFVQDNFESSNHRFMIIGKEKYEYGLTKSHSVKWIDQKNKMFTLLSAMYEADKIIIHGLWSEPLLKILFIQPWLLKKCYHVMWGGDFYFPEKQGWIKKQVIKRMGHFITYIKGDYELVKEWYGSRGEYHECFMYPSNLYKEYDIQSKIHETINIQIGNSADPTNNHLDILEKLEKYKDENIKIFAPLSYGNMEYAKNVSDKGKEIFGEKFIAMLDFMPFEKYLEFLGEIDIAIFAHKRQQAMGNTITLLGLGKKVYLDSETVQFDFFKKHDVAIFDVNNIDLETLNLKIVSENKEKIKYLFSKDVLLMGLQRIFNE